MQELDHEESDAFSEQRRVRHLTEVLVRNLSIPASFADGTASSSILPRPAFGRAAYSSSHAASSSTSGARLSFSRPADTSEQSRSYTQQRSKDDLDLHIPTLNRRRLARRKLTVSNGTATWAHAPNDTVDSDQPLIRHTDVKGKGRESNLASSHETLNSIQESEGSDPKSDQAAGVLDEDDSDLVFGWTSSSRTAVPLQRSRSKSSLKSSSSKRSISATVSKRLFKQNRRRRGSLIGSDDDEDGDSDLSEGDNARKGTTSKHERPVSPMSPRVSFQMASSRDHTFSPAHSSKTQDHLENGATSRARSASKGSILSVASGSSASTMRASAAFKHSEKEERFLRIKRYEDIRAHLVRSRLTLSVSENPDDSFNSSKPSLRPPITRTRTISLPLRGNHEEDVARQVTTGNAKQAPFYISQPHKKSMEPAFPLDFSSRDSLSLPSTMANASNSHRVTAQIWIEPDISASKEQIDENAKWRLLLEWDVDLRKLISLGTDPRLFPTHLPANTLIFRLANTEEYLTARLPTFMLTSSNEGVEEGSAVRKPFDENDDIEEGNVSDPGPLSSSQARRKVERRELALNRDSNRKQERLIARRKMILDRSVRETRMVQSVDDEGLGKIIMKEQDVYKSRAEILNIRSTIDDMLSTQPFRTERQHSANGVLLQQLQGDKTRLEADQEAIIAKSATKHAQLAARRQRLQEARKVLKDKEELLEQSKANHQLDMDVYRSILLSTSQRRASLISDLSTIFPIDLVDAGNVLFSICDIALPNGDFEAQASLQRSNGLELDDDHISSALGYVAQAVQLLAAYLTIPLYYPIRCVGSRSLVQDPISQMKGPKIFPLYSRGVDRYRFEYAVFLLNKDIEQIMLEHDIVVLDLTQTLPNLKNIYLTLSSDSVLRERKDTGPITMVPGGKPVTTQPIILSSESKPVKPRDAATLDSASGLVTDFGESPNVNGRIVNRTSEHLTTSTLEKLLGSGWSNRSKAPPDNASSPAKGRRRHAEASKTMTLLGGRSSVNTIH